MKIKPRSQRRYPEGKWVELLASIGSNEDVANVLLAAGYDTPPLGSIQGWRTRKSVPTRWVPVLLEWAMAQPDGIDKPTKVLREPV